VSEAENGKFEMHMVVELFGRQKIVGKVSEQTIGGGGFIRVDVPKTSKREAFTRSYGPSAIYAMTPVSAEVAQMVAESLEVEPVSEWQLSQALQQKTLAAGDRGGPGYMRYFTGNHDEDFDRPFDGDMPDSLIVEADSSLSESNPVENVLNIPDPAISTVATEQVMSELIAEDTEGDQYEEQTKTDKVLAAEWARELLAGDFVVLDTETTGLNQDRADEPIQIAVISKDGEVLFDSLMKATIPIASGAARAHGITIDALTDAPDFGEIRAQLVEALAGKNLVIWNASYDSAILDNADAANDASLPALTSLYKNAGCAMRWYAQFHGDWSDWHGSYTFQSLTNASKKLGLPVSNAHSALGDCLMTLAVIKKMAEYGQSDEA
jgi:DNA polymerase-3 subunit epsilon